MKKKESTLVRKLSSVIGQNGMQLQAAIVKEALKRHEESYPVELEGHGSPFYSLVSLSLQVVTDVSLSMKKETFNL